MKTPSRHASEASTSHFLQMRAVHRELLEKALHMRCVSFLADAKSNLLVQTISRVGASKRQVSAQNSSLQASLGALEREMAARRRAEQRLREITNAVEHAALMVCIMRGGRVVFANEALRRAFGGLPPAEGPLALLAAFAVDAEELPADDAAELPWSGEIRMKTRHDSRRWMRVSVTVGQDDDDTHFEVVVLEDVTAEREMRERAYRGQRLEALGQLVGGVAHDFNNILMVIHSNIELARTLPGDESGPLLDDVLGATTRGGRLTAQLLAFARRQVLKPELTDVVELVSATVDFLSRAFGPAHPLAVLPSRVADAAAHCDPGQLEAAVVNFAINAREASRVGDPIAVDIQLIDNEAERVCGPDTLPAGRFVAVSVIDKGCGVPADAADRIWEPFVSSKGHGSNSGLGLSMALGFARQSGGGVEHAPGVDGVGTRFTIYLPAHE